MGFYAYLLLCRDGSYYAGHTENLEARRAAHEAGEVDGYTATRRPVKLVWCEELPSRYEALAAERQIKGWSRAKKQALIEGDWQRVSLLARSYKQKAAEAKPGSAPLAEEHGPCLPARSS